MELRTHNYVQRHVYECVTTFFLMFGELHIEGTSGTQEFFRASQSLWQQHPKQESSKGDAVGLYGTRQFLHRREPRYSGSSRTLQIPTENMNPKNDETRCHQFHILNVWCPKPIHLQHTWVSINMQQEIHIYVYIYTYMSIHVQQHFVWYSWNRTLQKPQVFRIPSGHLESSLQMWYPWSFTLGDLIYPGIF